MEEADEVGRFATGMDEVVQNLKTAKPKQAKPKQKSKQTKGKQLDGTGQEPAITNIFTNIFTNILFTNSQTFYDLR